MRRQAWLQDGRDNHRFSIEVETTSGERFVRADDLAPVVVNHFGLMLALAPRQIARGDRVVLSSTLVDALILARRAHGRRAAGPRRGPGGAGPATRRCPPDGGPHELAVVEKKEVEALAPGPQVVR